MPRSAAEWHNSNYFSRLENLLFVTQNFIILGRVVQRKDA